MTDAAVADTNGSSSCIAEGKVEVQAGALRADCTLVTASLPLAALEPTPLSAFPVTISLTRADAK